ncbi:hypothetical protein NL108_007583 [Boleophthalmus pectinirostris]|uniref:eukaryotic translation initiation factor 5B n=1 Tax=Boleophthalmus pectinirostris TaxID=150288 RepID=UPI0024326AFF|nr:eukaryotic translation initiation factor 5B [Boleophthalmus pectinirostris]KAJ0070254.1 hypothetical protein NL108_007583 [Boleophthalmus pectinirostris]
MSDEDLLTNINHLLFQCALQTRDLSQKKNEISQQIKVYKDDIAEGKSKIETTKANIKTLEEDIKVKQNTLTQNKEVLKSMKAANSLVMHYEQTLKAELESRKASYNRDREEYEKRIASYRSSFQSYKEYYYSSPLAQKLLGLQDENRETEAKIKNYDDLITLKQEELNNLRRPAPVIETTSPDEPPVSEQLENEPEKHPVEDSSPSLHKTKEDPILSEEDVEEAQTELTEETEVRDSQQMEEQHQEETDTGEKDQEETGQQDALLEQQFTVLEIEQVMEVEMDEGPGENQTANHKADEALTSLSQTSSQGTVKHDSPARNKPGLATPTFPFTFSPGRCQQISDSSKSPAFPFNLHSEPSTPDFFGFGAQDEDPTLPFTSSFFEEKKTTDSKTSMEFLFNQPEPSEEFQFSFNTKSPEKESSSKDKAQSDFPFSFNF